MLKNLTKAELLEWVELHGEATWSFATHMSLNTCAYLIQHYSTQVSALSVRITYGDGCITEISGYEASQTQTASTMDSALHSST